LNCDNLTVVIPVKNEEMMLPICLAAIGKDFARKIVVLDSDSQDDTCKIANDWGAEVLQFSWDGKYPKKRNWFLKNYQPTTQWVLFLDADEVLTTEFKNEIQQCLSDEKFDGYWLKYTNYFQGKKMRGGYPLHKLALFKVGYGLYEEIDELNWSKLDMEIHEHPIIQGKVGKINAHIDHRDLRGMEHYVSKHAEYALWEARRLQKAKADLTAVQQWTMKQKVKYRLLQTPFAGFIFFIGSFIFLGGFLDGRRGLSFAKLKASYFNLISKRLKELNNSST
jgi:glycosyltransferase involved in cell wall biosynthesis